MPDSNRCERLKGLQKALCTTGLSPLLKRVKSSDPELARYITTATSAVWNALERVPMDPAQRTFLQDNALAITLIASAFALGIDAQQESPTPVQS